MRIKRFINIHTTLLLVLIITIIGVTYRFLHWGHIVNLEEIFRDSEDVELRGEYFDLYLPVMDAEGNIIARDKDISTILCFGNAPFADARYSENNLANLIARKTNATVYNCSIGDSYLSAEGPTVDLDTYPRDAYNFYWLCHLACKAPIYENCAYVANVLGDAAAPEAQEVYDTLWNLDLNTVDAIVIMYDASDYLAGRPMYNDDNDTDIQCFTGNLEAGIELIQENYPLIRIIVMSPAYAYAINEEGDYVSSDMYTYGWDVLSTYVIKEYSSCNSRKVSFVDHLYNTISSEKAKDYLVDNLHLNPAGRELIADRLVESLYYFKNKK